MHSALTGGFTYNGAHFSGDQAAIAPGDNFLSQLIPQLEATNAFQMFQIRYRHDRDQVG